MYFFCILVGINPSAVQAGGRAKDSIHLLTAYELQISLIKDSLLGRVPISDAF
jgi:hypothetical protein